MVGYDLITNRKYQEVGETNNTHRRDSALCLGVATGCAALGLFAHDIPFLYVSFFFFPDCPRSRHHVRLRAQEDGVRGVRHQRWTDHGHDRRWTGQWTTQGRSSAAGERDQRRLVIEHFLIRVLWIFFLGILFLAGEVLQPARGGARTEAAG